MKIDLNQEKKTKFLTEIGRCLERAGFQTGTEKDGLLPVFWNGESLCRVNAPGQGTHLTAPEFLPQ